MECQNKQIIKNIFNKNTELFINILSEFFPFSTQILDEYSNNEIKLISDISFSEKNINLLNWNELSLNQNLPWSIELIQKYLCQVKS